MAHRELNLRERRTIEDNVECQYPCAGDRGADRQACFHNLPGHQTQRLH